MAAQESAPGPVPAHVAIIMDGNGRWAAAKGRPRAFGHRAGVEAVRRTVRAAGELGITHLTLFGFSTENWRRPREEVDALFDLLRRFVDADLDRLDREGVRVRIIGRRDNLGEDVREIVERAETKTAANTRFNLTVAFNYGSRDEIARAAGKLAEAASRGEIAPEDIDPARFESFLDTAGLPDPDLVVRTSGERRTSNFLLWQSAYAEFVFLDVLWPDFGRDHLQAAIEEFAGRERRFGGVKRDGAR